MKNIYLKEEKIFYTENGIERNVEACAVSLFPEKYPEELGLFLKSLEEEEEETKNKEENMKNLKEETKIETEKVTGLWELDKNWQRDIDNGFLPTIVILWEEMGLKPYDFNSRFEEISGRDIHDCLSEIEDGEDCPLYAQTVEKMRSEFREVEIDFSDCQYRRGVEKHLVWSVDPNKARGYTEIEGLKIVNATPHPINFLSEETDKEYQVGPCGFILNATPEEELISFGDERGEFLCVRTVFKPTPAGVEFIENQKTVYPDCKLLEKIIVGSMIAAQAYPGQVVAMTPAKGFERVPPAEKRMNLFKYTIFEK